MRHRVSMAAILLAATLGCGGGPREDDAAVPLERVPAPALKAAKEQLPGVTFETAWKGTAGGKEIYEIRGKDKQGKIREAEVTPTGEVVEIE